MSTFDILRKESFYDRRRREKREAEVAEWSERLARKALHRESRQATAGNAEAWATWFRQSLYGELATKKNPIVAGIGEFVSIYTREKRDELRREFADQQHALEAKCAALEKRVENLTLGRREKFFTFAHERSAGVAGPSFPPGRKFVMKH